MGNPIEGLHGKDGLELGALDDPLLNGDAGAKDFVGDGGLEVAGEALGESDGQVSLSGRAEIADRKSTRLNSSHT